MAISWSRFVVPLAALASLATTGASSCGAYVPDDARMAPPPLPPPVPLFLVSNAQGADDLDVPFSEERVADKGLALSTSANGGVPNRTYTFHEPARAVVCVPPGEPFCAHRATVEADATLLAVDHDLALEWPETFNGVLLVRWDRDPTEPVSELSAPNPDLLVEARLRVRGYDFGTNGAFLGGDHGATLLNVSFRHDPACANGTAAPDDTACDEGFDGPRGPLMARDILLTLTVSDRHAQDVTLGQRLKVSLVLDGSSLVWVQPRRAWVETPLMVDRPYPPACGVSEVRVEPAVHGHEGDVVTQDPPRFGEGEVAFAPTAPAIPLLVALAACAVAWRRTRGRRPAG